jgi:hypothetical protein
MSRTGWGFSFSAGMLICMAVSNAQAGSFDEWGSKGPLDGDIPAPLSSGSETEFLRDWKRIEIPGAVCGDGSPYSVFVSDGDPGRLVLSFMGGGACWDYWTCYGPGRLTWLKGVKRPKDRIGGIYSADPARNAAADYDMIHFPYCTGDVHLGRHATVYRGKPTFHVGASNIEKAVAHLEQIGRIKPENTSDLVVYGYSAGALGALYHADLLDKKFSRATRKTLLSDAPGLHFGPKFWGKFTPELQKDYADAMKLMGHELDPKQGLIASVIGKVCERLSNWQIGVLQGTHDIVMSAVFGEVTPWDHARKVIGPGGLWEMGAKEGDNCTVWIPQTAMHTFLVMDFSAEIKAGGMDAWLYSRNRLEHRSNDRSYKD